MSLDVYLTGETTEVQCVCSDCGHMHRKQISTRFFHSNITHNLSEMAHEARIYYELWHPDQIGITKAKDLIKPLTEGLTLMYLNPERFKKHNAHNGWGLYENFVPWIQSYLTACQTWPEADVHTSC